MAKKIEDNEFINFLKTNDIVFPIMHGVFGEDGQIQKILEENSIPFVASSSYSCNVMYNKKHADEKIIKKFDFVDVPKLFLDKENLLELEEKISIFLKNNKINEVALKPSEGGSSIGVKICKDPENIISEAKKLLNIYHEIIVEEKIKGREFTIIILEKDGAPTALLPTEIELLDEKGNSTREKMFDKRIKYLSTTETRYFCPARFSSEKILEIRAQAEEIFKLAKANDFLRLDGWLLDDGKIYFSDFNPISGMEQNSFIFQQAAEIGFSHKSVIAYILANACKRQNLNFVYENKNESYKKRVNIILGGNTSERQVSLMSGSNVWLKLQNSEKFHPVPYLLQKTENGLEVFEVPYPLVLKHTTEEIYYHLLNDHENDFAKKQKQDIANHLDAKKYINSFKKSNGISLEEFLNQTKAQNADVFIALHGGFGEGGELQALCESKDIHFNGSGSVASRLCMDKNLTGEKITAANIENVRTCNKETFNISDFNDFNKADFEKKWTQLCEKFGGDKILVKPNGDGCSTGIVILKSAENFEKYIKFCKLGMQFIPENEFYNQPEKVQLPIKFSEMLFEEYIKVDDLEIRNHEVLSSAETGWIELTCGVLEKNGNYHALNPSVTVADNAVLSLEEKFQGGVGINLTPPPENIINEKLVNLIKKSLEKVAGIFKISDYCRIDLFANNFTNEIIIIEINTLPGLSPSTVLFQQGAKENPPLYPISLLEKIIS